MSSITGVLLTLSCIKLTTCEKDIFCQSTKHEFFVKQIGRCKKCDRCPSGCGYTDYNQVGVEMDPVHGAVSCLTCVPCLPGVTYRKFISFKPCHPCIKCTKQGKQELRSCTTNRNAKCLKPTERLLAKQNEQTESRMIPTIGLSIKAEQDNILHFKNTFLLAATAIVVLSMMSVTIIVKRGQKNVRIRELKRNHQMSDMEIQKIGRHLAADNMSKDIGRLLGVPNYEIQIIEEQNRNNLNEVAFQTLKKWQEIKGDKATKSELQKALRRLMFQPLQNDIAVQVVSGQRFSSCLHRSI